MAILLIVAYLVYVFFQARTHHGIYDAIFEADTLRDDDRHEELHIHRLTFVECVIALIISITLVTIIAISLVDQIPHLVKEQHLSDAFIGLILICLVNGSEMLCSLFNEWDENQADKGVREVVFLD